MQPPAAFTHDRTKRCSRLSSSMECMDGLPFFAKTMAPPLLLASTPLACTPDSSQFQMWDDGQCIHGFVQIFCCPVAVFANSLLTRVTAEGSSSAHAWCCYGFRATLVRERTSLLVDIITMDSL